MEGYYVEIVLHDKEAIPINLRPDCWDVEENFSFYISINGRLTDKFKKSLVGTPDLAEKLLEFWMPKLESRGYGVFSTEVKAVRLGKWEANWMITNTALLNEKLADNE